MTPPTLKPKDKVAIICPATAVKPEYVEGAVRWLSDCGLTPIVMPHALGPKCGSYASSEIDRLDDWLAALTDPDIKAIFCARGGYGCVHLVAQTPLDVVRENPKWLVGFSDVSALHALMHRAGVASIHGPMAKHLSGNESPCQEPGIDPLGALKAILMEAPKAEYEVSCPAESHPGTARGMLLGGNLQVLNNLAGTDLDLFAQALQRDVILFMEDIHEPIYAVERMLVRLWLAGILSAAKGLIFGRFTDYKGDANYPDMNAMLIDFFRRHPVGDKPIVFNFPVGHLGDNLPMIESAPASLEVAEGHCRLMMG